MGWLRRASLDHGRRTGYLNRPRCRMTFALRERTDEEPSTSTRSPISIAQELAPDRVAKEIGPTTAELEDQTGLQTIGRTSSTYFTDLTKRQIRFFVAQFGMLDEIQRPLRR